MRRARLATSATICFAGLVLATSLGNTTHEGEDAPMPYPGDIDPAWSPDGKEIVFASNRNPHDRQEHGFTLYVVDLESERIRPLTPWKYGGAKPAWSPDGKYVAFNSTSSGHIGMVEVASGEVTWLTSGERHGFDPSWAPDSQHVAFRALRGARDPDLFVLDIAKSSTSVQGQRRVTRLPGADRTPAWSPSVHGHPFGLTAVGCLIQGQTRQPASGSPGFPHPAVKDARTCVGWNAVGDSFLVVCKGNDMAGIGWTWQDMCGFFQIGLPEYMEGHWGLQGLSIADAMALDGGGSTSFRYRCVARWGEVRDPSYWAEGYRGRGVRSVVLGYAP